MIIERDSVKNYGIRIIILRVITFLNSKPVFVLEKGIGVISDKNISNNMNYGVKHG